MKRWIYSVSGIAFAAALILPLVTVRAAEEAPKDPTVEYRSQVMKSLGAQAAGLGMIMQKKVSYDANLALHAEMISLGAREALKAFEAKVPGGSAKPELWDNWKDFSDRLKALDTAASELAKAAKAGPVEPPKVLAALTCKGCHDLYKTK